MVTGTVIGVLPGIGPMATIAMLLPITFHITPVGALIMLSGIYYGAQYGGSTTAICSKPPGRGFVGRHHSGWLPDGAAGQSGTALSVAAVGSLFAGLTGIAVTVLFGPLLTEMALKLQPADYCALMVLGLVSAIVLASGSIVKAIAMIVLGLLVGVVGTDLNDGVQRLTFGIPQLVDGFDFTPIAMGLFGVSEIIHNIEQQHGARYPRPRLPRCGRRARTPGPRWDRSCAAPASGCCSASCPAAARPWRRSHPI